MVTWKGRRNPHTLKQPPLLFILRSKRAEHWCYFQGKGCSPNISSLFLFMPLWIIFLTTHPAQVHWSPSQQTVRGRTQPEQVASPLNIHPFKLTPQYSQFSINNESRWCLTHLLRCVDQSAPLQFGDHPADKLRVKLHLIHLHLSGLRNRDARV